MIDLFRQLKLEYQNYLILFKCDSFYVSFDEDATILNNMFGYKIMKLKNNIKVGFPLKLIENNKKILQENGIYYIIIENKTIIEKFDKGNNNYKKYTSSVFNIISDNNRINNIIKKIENITDKIKKDDILNQIEILLN